METPIILVVIAVAIFIGVKWIQASRKKSSGSRGSGKIPERKDNNEGDQAY